MPVKHRVRHSPKPVKQSGFLVKGKRPHRKQNAHKVLRKWPYYRSFFLLLCCFFIAAMSLLVVGYGVYQKNTKIIYMGLCGAGLWFIFRIALYLSSKAVSCPLCRACQLVSSKSNKHKNAFKIFPFSYATVSIITGALMRCVRCMHCGVTFDLNKK